MSKVNDFKAIINDPTRTENEIQKFIEENPNFLIQEYLLNHQLNLNCLISKFSVDGLETDFLYLSSSTPYWNIVLVELERQDISFFLKDDKTVLKTSAEFQKGINQINSWKELILQKPRYIPDQLEPFMRPLDKNPVNYKYVLITGRDSEIVNNKKGTRRLHTFATENNLSIHTYDSLIRWYENHYQSRQPNIFNSTQNYIKIKYLHSEPLGLFAYINKTDLKLDDSQRKQLIKWGFEIDKWEKGIQLTGNMKYAAETIMNLDKE